MLSKQVIQILQNSVPQLVNHRVLPFGWETIHNKRQLRIKSGIRELIPFYVLSTIDLLFLVPVLLFGPRACMENAHNIGEVVLPINALVCICIGVNLRWGFYTCRHEIATIINKFLGFESEVSQRKVF